MQHNNSESTNKLLLWIFGIVMTFNTSVLGWTCTQIIGLKEWKAEVTANRFTIQDGKQVWDEIYKIRQDIARLPNDPPKWFVDSFNELKQEVKELKEIQRKG